VAWHVGLVAEAGEHLGVEIVISSVISCSAMSGLSNVARSRQWSASPVSESVARAGEREVMADGGCVTGRLSGVAHMLQPDGPEHDLRRLMDGDTSVGELANVGCELRGGHASQRGLDGLSPDLVLVGSDCVVAAQIDAVDEDRVAG
jgi:hypothetical protein